MSPRLCKHKISTDLSSSEHKVGQASRIRLGTKPLKGTAGDLELHNVQGLYTNINRQGIHRPGCARCKVVTHKTQIHKRRIRPLPEPYYHLPLSGRSLHRLIRFRTGAHSLPSEMSTHLHMARVACTGPSCPGMYISNERHPGLFLIAPVW